MLEPAGLCTETAGMEMQLSEEWSQGLQRGRFAEQQKRAEEEAKSFGAELCRGESQRARAGRAAERAGMPGRERRQQRGHEARLGSHCAEQCALGFRKLTPRGSHPPPGDFSLPGARPLFVTCPPANGSLSHAPGYYLQASLASGQGSFFCWVDTYPAS